eukprot:CAMPEP_0201686720 /NCGR_PEP_ID=MMETSP0578-20130828/1059_1 /ASSEMBLY_ACC=CAM_ASM_000663 /TAXON_ID=267565 /ORGANISM="Skeletonema grethea, Strain CCMP 1804" /LENGTH=133 /DNA_ID=CAMNT_0048170809 /DNA_START=101 /DNA_END=502 /DNA_ORIENTATION=-
MSSVGNNYLTPKRSIICLNDFQACPPPPQAPSKLVGVRVLDIDRQGRLSDSPFGFFLAAPSSSSIIATDRSVQFKNNHIKLLPKKSSLSSYKYRVSLQPKGKSIDWAAGAATTTTEETINVEAAYRGRTARSA